MEREGKKVVVGVDHSQESLQAVQWALDNIVEPQYGDSFVLLHSQPPPHLFMQNEAPIHGPKIASDLVQKLRNYQEKATEAILEQAKKLCAEHQVEPTTVVVHGDPRDKICESVNELNADVLVMGSHSAHRSIKRAFLGSVTDYCAQNAHCAILIVKPS
ncbi:hypothetical protein O6H91_15G087500 [Diphasiastrum complanatum]|uniref:Uncharacterized protein n=1 Tax=Diphasiastrum complanatum TaxID=34168 RepID=A0ACC2BL81_DIPCM|nr:hypothetical protein O6H91_15G087500 [Diphasiastrum complanatum]